MPLETVEWPRELVAAAHEWLAGVDVVATLLEADTIEAVELQVALSNQRRATNAFEIALGEFQRGPRS